MLAFLFAERKLHNFVTSQRSSNIEKTAPCHRDSRPTMTMNCSDIDTTPARSAANNIECRRLPHEFDNSESTSPPCLLLNTSELISDCRTEMADVIGPDEVTCFDGQDKCSADFTRSVNIQRVDDRVVEPDVVGIDRNCNDLCTKDCEVDSSVDLSDGEKIFARDSSCISTRFVTDDTVSWLDPLLQKTVDDSVQDPSAVVTV